MYPVNIYQYGVTTYHHPSSDSYASATVRVGHDVSISHTQEGDGNEPHCVQQVRVLLVVVSEIKKNI
jgi:hypothetical protein